MKKIIVGIVSILLGLFAFAGPIYADSVSVNFENPPYTLGVINGQDGWVALGSAGSGCALYDQAVTTNTYGYITFGGQAFRISDAVTSGCFGDQAFAKPLADAVGEVDSTAGTFTVGSLQRHFEMQFDIASTIPGSQQSGLHVSVSPDRGDGSRMSYLRFEDGVSGIDVFFDDVQGTSNPANFVETQIATGLDRAVPHTVKLTLDAVDGPSNDIVRVWIDGDLKITGTSWENYYRYDSEAVGENSPRIVKTVIFRSAGAPVPTDAGYGFLFDNLTLLSGPIPTGAEKVDICHVEKKNSSNYHLISVNEKAKTAHLKHGDKIPGVDLTADCSQRLLTGEWSLSVNNGAYLHDMVIDTQTPGGALTGHGGYPAGSGPIYPWPYNWTLTGQLTGTSISLTLVYQNGYSATISGTIDSSWDSISGGAGTGGVTSWSATR